MVSFSFFTKLFSYFKPIVLQKGESFDNKKLLLTLFENQIQVECGNAIYSRGFKYAPFTKAYTKIYASQSLPKSCLFLGGGLGSCLKIFQVKYKHFPQSILVELDPLLNRWSKNYMELDTKKNVDWIQENAFDFIEHNTSKFDLIGIDIFENVKHDKRIFEKSFMTNLSKSMEDKGFVILNLIDINDLEKQLIHSITDQIKLKFSFIQLGRNTIYIFQKV